MASGPNGCGQLQQTWLGACKCSLLLWGHSHDPPIHVWLLQGLKRMSLSMSSTSTLGRVAGGPQQLCLAWWWSGSSYRQLTPSGPALTAACLCGVCRAAFNNDVGHLKRLLQRMPQEQYAQLDLHGNTVGTPTCGLALQLLSARRLTPLSNAGEYYPVQLAVQHIHTPRPARVLC